jgi:hypothetical protein
VGTSSAWEAGGGSCLCLPPGGGAGLSPTTPLNTPPTTAELRWRTDAPNLQLLAEVLRDAGPLWNHEATQLHVDSPNVAKTPASGLGAAV